jgi:hypothetical protein
MRATATAYAYFLALVLFLPGTVLAQSAGCRNDLAALSETVRKFAPAGLEKKELSQEERAALPTQHQAWHDDIPGLSPVYAAGYPRLVARDAAGLVVTIHTQGEKVMLLSINLPVVRIPREQQLRSVDALVEIARKCVNATPTTQAWLAAALAESWERASRRLAGDQSVTSTIIQDVFEGTRAVVWGVPPEMWEVLLIPS